MNRHEIISLLAGRASGTAFTLSMVRPAKLRAEFKGVDLVKVSLFQCQLAKYGNRGPVKQGVASGKRDAPELPAWVARATYEPNGLCFWYGADGTEYLAAPRFGDKVQSEWMLNGEPVPLSEVRDMLLASEYTERPTKAQVEDKAQVMFNAVKLINITQIY